MTTRRARLWIFAEVEVTLVIPLCRETDRTDSPLHPRAYATSNHSEFHKNSSKSSAKNHISLQYCIEILPGVVNPPRTQPPFLGRRCLVIAPHPQDQPLSQHLNRFWGPSRDLAGDNDMREVFADHPWCTNIIRPPNIQHPHLCLIATSRPAAWRFAWCAAPVSKPRKDCGTASG